MAQTFTAQEHRENAIARLEESTKYGVGSPIRPIILAEAQIHATLALSVPAEEKKAPARRKPAATKKTDSEAVPGSEEALIAQEAAQ